jgi:hypothetical protein
MRLARKMGACLSSSSLCVRVTGVLVRYGDRIEGGESDCASSGSIAWWLIRRSTRKLLVVEGVGLPVLSGLMRRCNSPTVRRHFGGRAMSSCGLQVAEALSLSTR